MAKRNVVKKFRDDNEAVMSTGQKIGVAVIGTGTVLGLGIAGSVLHVQNPFAKKTGEKDKFVDVAKETQISKDEFKSLDKEHKEVFGQGDFEFGQFEVDAAKGLHIDAKMKVGKDIVDKHVEITNPADSQKFLEDMFNSVGNVHFIPADGNLVLTGAAAQQYALNNLSIPNAGNVSQVVIKADRDYVANTGAGAVKVYMQDGKASKPIMIDAKQIDAAFDVFENAKTGDLGKITGKDKHVEKFGGFDVTAYVTLANFAENVRGLGDQWNLPLEKILSNIEDSFITQDAHIKSNEKGAFVNGTWDSVYMFATDVVGMTHANETEVAAKLANFNESKDRAGAVTYLKGLVQKWADAKDDGLVDPATYRKDWVPQSDVTNASSAILNTWRDDIWNTYSNVNGTNYLTVKYNITDKKELNNKDKAELWNMSQVLAKNMAYMTGYTAGENAGVLETILQQGNADALVLSAGSDGAKLAKWLDLLNGKRFDYTFEHSTNGTNAYNNFTQVMKEANVTLPINLNVTYNMNRYTFRVTDTRDAGSLMTVYNRDGKLMTTDTRILDADQTKAVKTWAKDYKVWSGSTEDE